MRVLVDDVLDAEQVPLGFKPRLDRLVRIPDFHAGKLRAGFFGQVTGRINRHDKRQLRVGLAGVEVVLAVAGRGVHAAGAAFERDMVAKDQKPLAVEEGVLVLDEFKVAARDADIADGVIGDAAGFHRGLDALGRHQVVIVADLDEGILKIRVQAGRDVGGQRPGGRRPDHDVGVFKRDTGLGQHAVGVGRELEADIDRIAGILAVFDLGFGQGGLVLRAPVNNPAALVDIALFGHLAEDFHLAGLKLRPQGQVGVAEIALHAEALELLVHDVDVLGRELTADTAQFELGNIGLFVAERTQGLELDRQAVGVIAGHIGGAEAGHILITDDDVLDDLVERGAHVNVAVGVRRAVMQNEEGFSLIVFDHLLIDMVFLPVLEHFGFLFRQAGPHFKRGCHLVDGIVVILRQGGARSLSIICCAAVWGVPESVPATPLAE